VSEDEEEEEEEEVVEVAGCSDGEEEEEEEGGAETAVVTLSGVVSEVTKFGGKTEGSNPSITSCRASLVLQ
jgi:hypothetical protein